MRVFLAAPYGRIGGGMGRLMEYVIEAAQRSTGSAGAPVVFERLESRGAGPAWAAPVVLARAAVRLVRARGRGERVVLHLNVAEGGSLARKGALLLLGRAIGAPVLLHLHAADIFGTYARLPVPGRWLLRAMFRAATCCAVLGTPWRDWLRDVARVPAGRIVVLANGVPPPPGGVPAVRAGAPLLVFLGNLLARKGLDDLLAALARDEMRRRDWRLLVVGGGDPAGYAGLAQGLGLADRVRFAGWLEPAGTAAALAAASALVLPSRLEAMPLAILEALSHGVPVVATRVGAIPEFLEDGRTAKLIAPGDRAGLAAAMAALLGDPALARRLGEAGRALYLSRFTDQAFLARLLAVYRERLGVWSLSGEGMPRHGAPVASSGEALGLLS